MAQRLVSFIALVLSLAAAVALDHKTGTACFTALLLAALLTGGLVEFNALLRRQGQDPFPRLTAPFVPVFFLLAMLDHRLPGAFVWRGAGLFVLVLLLLIAQIRRCDGRGSMNLGGALLALSCVLLPGSLLLALRLEERGLLLILYLVATAKMTDNGALLVGRLWGRHKLAPAISPGKTVEGFLGGLAVGTATAVLLAPLCGRGGLANALLFGLTVSLLATLGDLTESLLKREAGVKDSGALLPGIGGILDLLDSTLLAAPAGYFLLLR